MLLLDVGVQGGVAEVGFGAVAALEVAAFHIVFAAAPASQAVGVTLTVVILIVVLVLTGCRNVLHWV